MATYDPRVLARRIDDLSEQLCRWSMTASSVMEASDLLHRNIIEVLDRVEHRMGVLSSHVQDEEIRLNEVDQAVRIADVTCSSSLAEARSIHSEAVNLQDTAQRSHDHWHNELEQATEWQARAEDRFNTAMLDYEAACGALEAAKSELRSAQSRLSACRVNPRADCSSLEYAVVVARNAVYAGEAWVAQSHNELESAREEVDRAIKRVQCCTQAVRYVVEAVSSAAAGIAYSEHACNSSERSIEHTRAAFQRLTEARRLAIFERNALEAMQIHVRGAQLHAREAEVAHQRAESDEDIAQSYFYAGRHELTQKIDQLEDLNRIL